MTASDDLHSSLAGAASLARSLGLPEPNPSHVSLQGWCLNGKALNQKRNARTNPAGTFAALHAVTSDGTEWSTFKRGEGCEGLAIGEAVGAGYP